MDYLEHLHRMLLDNPEAMELVEQAILQRDRLLYGVNSRYAELHAIEKEHGLLKERYHLLHQKYNQLVAVNQSLLTDLRQLRGTP